MLPMRTYLTSACAFAVAGTSVPLPAEVFHAVRYVYSNADDLVAVRYRFQGREK